MGVLLQGSVHPCLRGQVLCTDNQAHILTHSSLHALTEGMGAVLLAGWSFGDRGGV